MNDEQILDLYFARDEQAVAETDRKYGGYCFTLANSILHSDQDAEETVSDTYLRAWNTIPPKRPGIFKMFLAKITRNLAFSRWRSMNAEKRGGGEMTLVLEELDDCSSSVEMPKISASFGSAPMSGQDWSFSHLLTACAVTPISSARAS